MGAQLDPVEPNIGQVIDRVESQENLLVFEAGWQVEPGLVPGGAQIVFALF